MLIGNKTSPIWLQVYCINSMAKFNFCVPWCFQTEEDILKSENLCRNLSSSKLLLPSPPICALCALSCYNFCSAISHTPLVLFSLLSHDTWEPFIVFTSPTSLCCSSALLSKVFSAFQRQDTYRIVLLFHLFVNKTMIWTQKENIEHSYYSSAVF